MSDSSYVETVERLIPAPADRIFALIADPSRHQEIDGSGAVRDAKAGSSRVALGDTFGMSMKRGLSYSTQNEVIEYEEGRRLAWQTHAGGRIGRRLGGPIWRYELEPTEGGTLVRESWDLSDERIGRSIVWRSRTSTRKNMEQTLARIEEVVAS